MPSTLLDEAALSSAHRLERLRCATLVSHAPALLLVGGVDARHSTTSKQLLHWLLANASGLAATGVRAHEPTDEAMLVLTRHDVRLYLVREHYADSLALLVSLWPNLRLWLSPQTDDAEVIEEHKARAFVQMVRDLPALGLALTPEALGSGASSCVESWPIVQAFALQDFASDGGGFFLSASKRLLPLEAEVMPLLFEADAAGVRQLVDDECMALRRCWLEMEAEVDSAVARSQKSGLGAEAVVEASFVEALLAFEDHAEIKGAIAKRMGAATAAVVEGAKPASVATTRLLMGERTRHIIDSGSESVKTEGEGYARPRHMTIEARGPAGPIYAGRTYFLGSAIRALPRAPSSAATDSIVEELVRPEDDVNSAPTVVPTTPSRRGVGRARSVVAAAAAAAAMGADADISADEVTALQGVYGALASLTIAALTRAFGGDAGEGLFDKLAPFFQPTAAENATSLTIIAVAAAMGDALTGALRQRCVDAKLELPRKWAEPLVKLSLEAIDMLGQPADGCKALRRVADGRLLLHARATVHLSDRGVILFGSTAVADACGGVYFLDEAFPLHGCWQAAGIEAASAREVVDECERMVKELEAQASRRVPAASEATMLASCGHALLGRLFVRPLTDCALLVGGDALSGPLRGELYALEHGAVLRHRRLGAIVLRFDGTAAAPQAATLHSTTEPLIISFTFNAVGYEAESLAGERGLGATVGAAAALRAAQGATAEYELMLAVSGVSARRIFISTVLPRWKEQWADKNIAYRQAEEEDGSLIGAGAARMREATEALRWRWPSARMSAACAARTLGDARLLALPCDDGACATPRGLAAPAGVSVVIFLGLPGSGVSTASRALCEASPGGARWLHTAVDSSIERLAGLDVAVAEAMQRAAESTGSGDRSRPVLLEVCGQVGAVQLVAATRRAISGLNAKWGSLSIASVLTCICAPRALVGSNPGCDRSAEGLVEQVVPGFCQTILLTRIEELDATSSRRLQNVISVANPLADVVRGVHGARAAAAEAIARTPNAPRPFESAAHARARNLARPGWSERIASPGALRVFKMLPPPSHIVLEDFTEAVQSALARGALSALHGYLVAVERRDIGVPQIWQLDLAQGAPSEPCIAPEGSEPQLTCGGFTSMDALRDVARALLESRDLPEILPPLTPRSIPKEESARALARLDEMPLPSGWFHDGLNYVSVDGERMSEHPGKAEVLDALVERLNQERAEHNARVTPLLAEAVEEGERYLAAALSC